MIRTPVAYACECLSSWSNFEGRRKLQDRYISLFETSYKIIHLKI